MKKNAMRGSIVLALLLAVFCVVAFAVPFARTAAFWIAFGFGAFAILFQLYIFKTSFSGEGDAKSRFYGFPIARLGVYYLACQLIVSVVEMALSSVLPTWVPLIINVILAVLTLVGCITAETMRDEIVRQDGRLKQNVSAMRELQSMAASLAGTCGDEALKPTLTKLTEEFRFSDPVTSDKTTELESDMRAQLGDIQQALVDGDTDGAKALCAKLTASLTERNRICSISK